MTKKKQKNQTKKPNTQHKQIMKDVLSQLAKNKQQNQSILPKLHPIAHLNHLKHEKKKKKTQQSQDEEPVQSEPIKPIVNIFAVQQYISDKPVQVKMIDENQEQQLDLESRARKVMGESFNIDKFGDKPLKVVNEQNQQIILSEDEDQPNCQKNITHQNIKIPQGYIKFKRTKQIQQVREKLPIFMKEQQIIETVNTHLVCLICGETGSGKSTQLPQFLAEKNYQNLGKIAITQPRRLATISLANRVAQEMNLTIGKQIGYQVRHDRKQSPQSFIKFMTDGILLKEMSTDPLLMEYSVILIDEAHERKLNTDILIGLLSKLILIRYKMSLQKKCQPLRLVIMSATMRIQDFQNQRLFSFPLPILKVESRMFPVTIFHQKKTPSNYIDAAVKKCIKIHKKLPPGDVLIFLTGKDEIHQMFIKLQQGLQRASYEEEQFSEEEVQRQGEEMNEEPIKHSSFIIYKLYSSLPSSQQQKIFDLAPSGTRKFIISTNISQTSITVPNIRYVIDSGQEKHRYFDKVWKWRKGYGSKAMAQQRAGRAGRTAHGYCYRLYSSALYANKMEKHPDPQICKLPLDTILLQIKSIGFKNVYGFPFPTQPEQQRIFDALEGLQKIKAIEGIFNKKDDWSNVTQLGKIISFIPLEPRLAKMLLLGSKEAIQQHTLLSVCLLTIQSIFLQNFINENEEVDENLTHKQKLLQIKRKKQQNFSLRYNEFAPPSKKGDIFLSINIVGEFFTRVFKNKGNKSIEQCIQEESHKLQLNSNVMRQLYYNCDQISEIYQTLTDKPINLSTYEPLASTTVSSILDLLLMTFPFNICRIQENNKYQQKSSDSAYIHNFSPLYKEKKLFVGFIDLFKAQNGRNYMHYPFIVENYELFASFGTVPEPTQFTWKNDRIVGKVTGEVYGWEVPNILVYNPKTQLKYYFYARFLLEGKIIPVLKILTNKNMLIAPPTIIKPDNLDEKVQKIVYAFKSNEIETKEQLQQKFRVDKHFLEKQLKLWIKAKNYLGVYESLRKHMII